MNKPIPIPRPKGLLIGIPVDPQIASDCWRIARELWAGHNNYFRWFPHSSLHCTLAHMRPADTSIESRLRLQKQMMAIMDEVGPRMSAFESSFSLFEWFGPDKEVLVLTRPTKQADDRIVRLSNKLIHAVQSQGLDSNLSRNWEFRPHVSLGSRNPQVVNVKSSIYDETPRQTLHLSLPVDRISLYETVPAQASLTKLHTAALQSPTTETKAMSTTSQ